MRVAVIGLGRIGFGVARLVGAAGHELSVFDVDAEAAARCADIATVAASPRDAADHTYVALIAVYDDAQVREVLAGEAGIFEASVPPAVVVVLSTVTLETIRWAHAETAERGIGLLDCGVSRGGGPPDQPRTLVLMVGGTEGDLVTARPVLESFGNPVLHMGELGAGMKTKVARNLTYYAMRAVAWEGARLAAAAGVDVDAFVEAAEACDAQGTAGAFGYVAQGLGLGASSSEGAGLAGYGHKDLQAAIALADEAGIELPIGKLTDELFDAVTGLAESQ